MTETETPLTAKRAQQQPAENERDSGTRAQSYRRLLANEAGIWRSLLRWITRRPRSTAPNAAFFGYAAEVTPILLAFTALAALEIPILPLLLPWPEVRYPLAILGAWALLWMLGLLASLRVHPHVVSDDGLQLRSGFQLDLRIPWAQIATVQRKRFHAEGKHHVEHDNGASLNLQKTSNLEVTLNRPLTVRFIDGRTTEVNSVRFYADTPNEFLTAVAPKTDARGAQELDRVTHPPR